MKKEVVVAPVVEELTELEQFIEDAKFISSLDIKFWDKSYLSNKGALSRSQYIPMEAGAELEKIFKRWKDTYGA